MADSLEVLGTLRGNSPVPVPSPSTDYAARDPSSLVLSALTPNMQGFENALSVDVEEIAVSLTTNALFATAYLCDKCFTYLSLYPRCLHLARTLSVNVIPTAAQKSLYKFMYVSVQEPERKEFECGDMYRVPGVRTSLPRVKIGITSL